MKVREAVGSDAPAVAALGGLSEGAAARLVRERAVRVAEADDEVVGFVAFDRYRGAVHVTRFGGDREALEALLREPVRYADAEGVPVEIVVPASDGDAIAVLERHGFEESGRGPMFSGERSPRFRLE